MTAKPRSRWLRALLQAVALLLLLAIPPLLFYGWHEHKAQSLARENALDGGFANALKHAGAAASLYSFLSAVSVPPAAGESLVLKLGVFNEYAETVVKGGAQDSTLEMMRDLHNNLVGVSIEKWRGNPGDRRGTDEILVMAAKSGLLWPSVDSVPLEPALKTAAADSQNWKWAVDWFDANRASIEASVFRVLAEQS